MEPTDLAAESEMNRFFRILDIIKTEFTPKDAYLREGVPTFIIPLDAETFNKADKLAQEFAAEGLAIVMERSESDVILQVVLGQAVPRPMFGLAGLNLPLILFLATIVTVTISGYYESLDYVSILLKLNKIARQDQSFLIWTQTALYTITIMGVVGLHEVGHYLTARRNGIRARLPLFIPGIPRITPGTFGAFIRQEGPARNRNQLFDIGISGPMVGFFIAIVASAVGYSMSLPLTYQQYIAVFGNQGAGGILPPLLFLFLGPWFFRSPNAYTYVLHPLASAAWLGTLITFLNTFPIGQLDGGHVFRAVLGRVWHRRLGYIMIAVMFITGWWAMAILVLLLIRAEHPGALDDVTPITFGRKLLALAFVVMFIAVFTLSPESPILTLLYGQ